MIKEWPDTREITTQAEMLDMLLAHRDWLIQKNRWSRTARYRNWTDDDIAEAYAEVWIKLATLKSFKPGTCAYWRNYFFRCFNSYYIEAAGQGRRSHSAISKLPISPESEMPEQHITTPDDRITSIRLRLSNWLSDDDVELLLGATIREPRTRGEVPAISTSLRKRLRNFLSRLNELSDASVSRTAIELLEEIKRAYGIL